MDLASGMVRGFGGNAALRVGTTSAVLDVTTGVEAGIKGCGVTIKLAYDPLNEATTPAIIPPNEPQRMAAVKRYDILDTRAACG
jgi:hypothetical protein